MTNWKEMMESLWLPWICEKTSHCPMQCCTLTLFSIMRTSHVFCLQEEKGSPVSSGKPTLVQAAAPGLAHFPRFELLTLAFHGVWACVFPLVPLTMGLRKCVGIRFRPLGSPCSERPNFKGQWVVNPREARRWLKKAQDLWMGVTTPGVLKEKHCRDDVPLAGESVATCLFKPWVVRVRSVPQRQATQCSRNLWTLWLEQLLEVDSIQL